MARKKIVYFHHGGTVGGAPLSLLFLLKQLDRQRFDPLVVFTADGPVVKRYRDAGIPVRLAPGMTDFSHTELVWYGNGLLWMLPLKAIRYLPTVRISRAILEDERPDLVHINSSALAAPAQAAHALGIPVVWHIREPLAHGYLGIRRAWLRRQIHTCATRVIAISQYDASQLIPSSAVRVIYNFVNLAEFDRTIPGLPARHRLGLTPAQHVVTMLGGCSYSKGTLPFVRSLTAVRAALPNVRYLVVGPAPAIGHRNPTISALKYLFRQDAYDRAVLRAAGPHLDRSFIRFPGVRNDIPDVLAASDLVVFPSVRPHFARPIIEAGAMAKPVVASNLGGPRELVRNNITGLLTPPDDPAALAEAIIKVLSTPGLAGRMGAAGYEQALEKFEAQRNAQATFALYDEML